VATSYIIHRLPEPALAHFIASPSHQQLPKELVNMPTVCGQYLRLAWSGTRRKKIGPLDRRGNEQYNQNRQLTVNVLVNASRYLACKGERMRFVYCCALACVLAGPAAAAAPESPRVTPVVLAYRRARPAVVNISAEKIVRTSVGLFGGDPFEGIFPGPFTRHVPVKSLGSGFLISPAGYIVTNAHVIRKAQKITVMLTDGSHHAARVISADAERDLAVLKIDPPDAPALTCLALGRSDDLMVGETVIAIGNPLGYANTVTTGVISAVGRTLKFRGGVKYTGLIQTDAPINHGNSGGPLLNIKGDLIGINTAIRADAANIGFAIPVDALAAELGRLLDFERINRVIFGASVLQRHGKGGDVLYVSAVRAGTPADGKLRAGDRILALNGKDLRQITDYTCAMLAVKAGTEVRLKVLREGRELTAAVRVAAKPRPNGKALAEQLFGMTLRPVTAALAGGLRLAIDHGLLVVGVRAGGPADKLGVKSQDVLFQVGQLYVKDFDQLGTVLEDIRGGQSLRIGIVRGNVAAWVRITAAKTPPVKKDGK